LKKRIVFLVCFGGQKVAQSSQLTPKAFLKMPVCFFSLLSQNSFMEVKVIFCFFVTAQFVVILHWFSHFGLDSRLLNFFFAHMDAAIGECQSMLVRSLDFSLDNAIKRQSQMTRHF